jgi:hypothetical protein
MSNLAKVVIDMSYVVDTEDPHMIERAVSCIMEDLHNAIKYNELENYIVVQDPDPSLKESDIPEFLLEDETEEEYAREY